MGRTERAASSAGDVPLCDSLAAPSKKQEVPLALSLEGWLTDSQRRHMVLLQVQFFQCAHIRTPANAPLQVKKSDTPMLTALAEFVRGYFVSLMIEQACLPGGGAVMPAHARKEISVRPRRTRVRSGPAGVVAGHVPRGGLTATVGCVR